MAADGADRRRRDAAARAPRRRYTGMDIAEAVIAESIKAIDNAYGRICHCLVQLDEDHVWLRKSDHVNSIGIIVQHLCGNLRQWIVSGIGGQPDVRHRPSEFKDQERPGKDELLNRLGNTVHACKRTISELTAGQLLEQRRIQGFEETVLGAMRSAIPHLELHAGQIVYITRLLLGDKYELRWKPSTKEQGAETDPPEASAELP